MRFEKFLISENVFRQFLNNLKNYSYNKVLKFLKKNWKDTEKIIIVNDLEKDALNIINKQLNTNFKRLKDVDEKKLIRSIKSFGFSSESIVNEDFKHWWEDVKKEGFPTLSFYPALTAWMELGKLLEPDDMVNWNKVSAYGFFWLLLVSGKYYKSFLKWKKENPEDYKKEKGLI